MLSTAETIAAIATARAPAALGIVRISGPRAAAILDKVVPGCRATAEPRRLSHGVARAPAGAAALDEVLCFYAPGPRTATGEDVAEIHGHGGTLVLEQLLAAVISAGARPAEPGEFTYRAFVNGRIDLTQAEAIAALIGARSERAARASLHQLRGAVGERFGVELDRLNELAARVEASLDFPDEDLPPARARELARQLQQVVDQLDRARRSFALGARLFDGARIAIVGPTNAGKSSLFNRLAGAERAIVDPSPGTTRDVVEARGVIAGIPVTFCDTAGLREANGRVERRGIERSREAVDEADVVVVVVDGADPRAVDWLPPAELLGGAGGSRLLVLNKRDLPAFAQRIPPALTELPRIAVSALDGSGLAELTDALARALGGDEDADAPLLTTARQRTVVLAAIDQATRAQQLLTRGAALELAAVELQGCRASLASLLGRDAPTEVLDTIFATFCLGK